MTEILLSSGDSLTTDEVFEAMLLLARSRADFPVVTERDAQIAVAMLALDVQEFNAERHVI